MSNYHRPVTILMTKMLSPRIKNPHPLLSNITLTQKLLSREIPLPTVTLTTSRYHSSTPATTKIEGMNSYVHPLSQIVLERLQSNHSDYLIATGLDKGLTLEKDGTFVLRYPSQDDREGEDCQIWTRYEPEEKKHWLSVRKNGVEGQFLLQDNLKSAWHSSALSTPEKVRAAVDKMISRML